MKVELLKVRTFESDATAMLYQAKICLSNAEGFLLSEEVTKILDDKLIYDLTKEIRNLIYGINVSIEIAKGGG
jgi:hypothetical protein